VKFPSVVQFTPLSSSKILPARSACFPEKTEM
jgi:hypothetical protein